MGNNMPAAAFITGLMNGYYKANDQRIQRSNWETARARADYESKILKHQLEALDRQKELDDALMSRVGPEMFVILKSKDPLEMMITQQLLGGGGMIQGQPQGGTPTRSSMPPMSPSGPAPELPGLEQIISQRAVPSPSSDISATSPGASPINMQPGGILGHLGMTPDQAMKAILRSKLKLGEPKMMRDETINEQGKRGKAVFDFEKRSFDMSTFVPNQDEVPKDRDVTDSVGNVWTEYYDPRNPETPVRKVLKTPTKPADSTATIYKANVKEGMRAMDSLIKNSITLDESGTPKLTYKTRLAGQFPEAAKLFGNTIANDAYKVAMSLVRPETGAAIGKDELSNKINEFMPGLFTSDEYTIDKFIGVGRIIDDYLKGIDPKYVPAAEKLFKARIKEITGVDYGAGGQGAPAAGADMIYVPGKGLVPARR